MTLHWCSVPLARLCMQIFETIETLHAPPSPGSRPPERKTYDPLRVARETAEEVSQIQRVSSMGSNLSKLKTRFASDSKLNEMNMHHVTFCNPSNPTTNPVDMGSDLSMHESHDNSDLLNSSRRADSVASCASEWVQRGVRSDGRKTPTDHELEEPVPESAPAYMASPLNEHVKLHSRNKSMM
jgi:hypothetical protein